MSYRRGENLSSDHVLTDPGEFRAIARDFGVMTAMTCWLNTHPMLGMLAGGVVGIGVVVAIVAAVL